MIGGVANMFASGAVTDVLAGPMALGGVVVFYLLLVVMWLLLRAQERRAQRALNYRVGRWGEEQIVEQFREVLDGRWTLIRNFVYPGHKGDDIDLLLIGPAGVWAFEVKAYAGEVRNRATCGSTGLGATGGSLMLILATRCARVQ